MSNVVCLMPCGDIEAFSTVVKCQCGLVRQSGRPHAFYANLQIKGWFCECGIFNGEEKETKLECRTCQRKRPAVVEGKLVNTGRMSGW